MDSLNSIFLHLPTCDWFYCIYFLFDVICLPFYVIIILLCVHFQLKQIEVQLEEEYDDKQKVLRERRDLEAKLLLAQDQVRRHDIITRRITSSFVCCSVPMHSSRCGVGYICSPAALRGLYIKAPTTWLTPSRPHLPPRCATETWTLRNA